MVVLRIGASRLKTQSIRSVAGLVLLLAFLTPSMQLAQDAQAAEVVQKVADAQKRLPWFWSPPVEGLADIPFTYESKQTRRVLDHRGKEVLPRKTSRGFYQTWRSVHMERIALDEGSYYRCLVQDGISPCSEELMEALEQDSQKRENFTPEDKARIRNIREERHRRHQRFWTEFPEALSFERIGISEIHFVPRRDYQATDAPPTTMLAKMTGRFWFDPLTYEITKMEYELLGDADSPVVPLSKGTNFSIELARLAADGPLLPARLSVRRKLSQGRKTENSSTDLFNFRRFAVESDVRFTEPDEVSKPSKR